MDLDAHVRSADFDRWASSRLISDADARADLIALYAFEAELMAIPTRVTQPLLAEMRYAWWADQMDGVFAGDPRKGHPVLERLSACVQRRGLDRSVLDDLIQAHIGRVHSEPHGLTDFFVRPMGEAVRILIGEPREAAETAGLIWGQISTGDIQAARSARSQANRQLRDLPVLAFPAVAHAGLFRREEPEAVKRLRITWAALRGRI